MIIIFCLIIALILSNKVSSYQMRPPEQESAHEKAPHLSVLL